MCLLGTVSSLLAGPGDTEMELRLPRLTSAGLSISATPESMHVNLGETGHPECTFQVLLPCEGQAILKDRVSLLYFLCL